MNRGLKITPLCVIALLQLLMAPLFTCPLICLKRAKGALRPLPAHLPDTRQRSCATTAQIGRAHV